MPKSLIPKLIDFTIDDILSASSCSDALRAQAAILIGAVVCDGDQVDLGGLSWSLEAKRLRSVPRHRSSQVPWDMGPLKLTVKLLRRFAASSRGLISWSRSLRASYKPQVGDIIVGRVIEVALKHWRVEIDYSHDAVLMLSSMNLPDGIQAVTIKRAEEKGTTVGLLAKLHHGVVELLDEAAGALHTASMECKDISSRFVHQLLLTSSPLIKLSWSVLEKMRSCNKP